MDVVYILECSDGTLYTGWTNNLEKRIKDHNAGKGAKYTKYRLPCKLVYFQKFETKSEALSQEYKLKRLSRKEKIEMINAFYLKKEGKHFIIQLGGLKMKKELKFYICNHCKNVIVKLSDSNVPVVCCGEQMPELLPNTIEASQEKHLPVIIRKEDNRIEVRVGTIDHPMEEAHYIEWIILETESGYRVQHLAPGEHNYVEFLNDEKVIAVYAYCNLHGLWKTSA